MKARYAVREMHALKATIQIMFAIRREYVKTVEEQGSSAAMETHVRKDIYANRTVGVMRPEVCINGNVHLLQEN